MNRIETRISEANETVVSRMVGNLTPFEKRNFSYVRLINFLASERRGDTCLESDLANTLAKELPLIPDAKAAYCPLSLSGQRSGLDTKSGASGGYLAGVDVARDLIELLRAKTLLLKLGGSILSLPHARALPVETTGSTATWTGENPGSDLAESDMAYGARIATPHTLMVTTAFSRKLLSQTGGTVEAFVRADLARAIAVAVDAAGINGSGLENQPVGILKIAGIGSVVGGTNGAVPDFDDVLNLEYAVAAANADVDYMAYISTPAVRKLLKKTQEVSGSSKMVWSASLMNGYLAQASTNMPSNLVKGNASTCHAILLGDFSQLIVAQFGGGLALLVDPFAAAKQGKVEVTAFLDCDIVVRRPEAFSAMQDALLS